MNNDTVLDEERLYKVIKSTIPNHWNFEHNRPSSAAFKDSLGVSVDRDGNRSLDQIKSSFQSRGFRLRAVISVTALECRQADTHPFPKPEPNNPYHCLIYESPNKIEIRSSRARKLSKNARIDYFNPDLT